MTLEEQLSFYKGEVYDEDMKDFLYNRVVAISILNEFYSTEMRFNGNYCRGRHWMHYLFLFLKVRDGKQYTKAVDLFGVDEYSIEDRFFSFKDEWRFISFCYALTTRTFKVKIGAKLNTIVVKLIRERVEQIEAIEKRIKERQ